MTSADDPEYTTHAVAERTGIPAETFLAWERRHGVPMPHRTANQERLYSRRDIADITWLRKRTNAGIPIRHAVSQLKATTSLEPSESRSSVDVVVSMTATPDIATRPAGLLKRSEEQTIVASITNALIRFDERLAGDILAAYVALGTTSFVTSNIVPDVLASLMARVNTGETSPAGEKLGRLFLGRKLGALLDIINPHTPDSLTIVAGVSTETQELDVLLAAIRLAHDGQQVLILGSDISLIDLVTVTSAIHPQQIALVASTANGARMTALFREHLRLHFPGDAQLSLLALGPAFPAQPSRHDEYPDDTLTHEDSTLRLEDYSLRESGDIVADR